MTKKKILLVEDDAELSKLVRLRLIAAGFEVSVVPDAILAVQEAVQSKPDLVVLDLMLPAGGGFTVLQRLRSLIHTAYIPVLIISGIAQQSDPEYFEQIKKVGIEGFLKKPFEGKQLVAEVLRILGGDPA